MNSTTHAHGGVTRPAMLARGHWFFALVLFTVLVVAGCNSGTDSSGSNATASDRTPATHPTSTAVADATSAPFALSQTLAWVATSGTGAADVWISVHGGSARQVTHIPNTNTDPCSASLFGPPVVSPDGTHIAVVTGPDGGAPLAHGTVCLIDVATGATTPVPDSVALDVPFTDTRSVGWLDDTTLWLAEGNLATYALGAADAVALPNTGNAVEAVVRGSTVFYLAADLRTAPAATISVSLHRYSLTTHSALGAPINLGAFDQGTSPIQVGFVGFPGWDAAPDGAHVAYQLTTAAPVSSGNPAGIADAKMYVAAADGSAPRQILQALPLTSMVSLRFSPDGSHMAATEASPGNAIATGCITSPGAAGDPCFHAYALPDSVTILGYPIWSPDSRSFLLGNVGPGGGLWRYAVGVASGVLVWHDGYSPWAA